MDLYRDVSPGDINLADMAESLDYDEQKEIASMMDGWEHMLNVNPSYAFRASGKDEDLYNAVELTSVEREQAKDILDNNEYVSNTRMPVNWESTSQDIMDMFDRYEDPEDPFTVSRPEHTLLNKIKAEARGLVVEDDAPSWTQKVRTKEFPGIGEVQQIADGAYKTVYAGPVDGENFETVVYAPTDGRRPGVFEDSFSESLIHTLAIDHNTDRLNEDGRTPASETVEPVVVDIRGQPYAVAVGEYADMRNVPDEHMDEAKSLAQELEQDIRNRKLYYHSTFNRNASQEFAKAGLRRDNIKFDDERGIVIADPGEAGEADFSDVREVLGEERIKVLENHRERVN